MNPIFSNFATNLQADGLAALNLVGPALIGLAASMYLFLQVLRMFSRRFLGKDFRIQYTPPNRKQSNFQFKVSNLDKPIAEPDANKPDIVGLYSPWNRNHEQWKGVAEHLTGEAQVLEIWR